jgi:hypothetical protein
MGDFRSFKTARRAPARPMQPVVDPAGWTAEELRDVDTWSYSITEQDIGELEAGVDAVRRQGIAIVDVSRDNFPLDHFADTLADIRRELIDGRGIVMMQNFPVERLDREATAIAYLGLGSYLGKTMSQNKEGHILGHVKDLGGDYSDPNTRGYMTRAEMRFHTDPCDYVGLLCLQTAMSGGASRIASSVTVYNRMLERRPDLVAELTRPVYRDRRGEVPEGAKEWYAVPVFNPMPDGGLVTTYVRSAMRKAQRFAEVPRITPELDAACDLFDRLAESPEIHLDMDFRPGDIQFLNNHWIVHSRTAFEDFAEPERRRHLFRLWLACDDGPRLPEVYLEAWQGATAKGRPAGIRVPGVKLNAPLDAE